jgi:amino acid transporter
MEKKPITHVTAGLIIAAVLIIWSMFLQFMDLTGNTALGWVQTILVIILLIIFINLYGKAHDNTLSFGNLFAYGFKTSAVFTVIQIIFLVIFFLIFPDMKEKTFEVARQKMEENPNITEDQIEQGLEWTRKLFWVFVIAGTMFALLITGVIASLIGAAITKKRPHNPLEQQTR